MSEVETNNYFEKMRNKLYKWENRFIKLAEHIATWSKDPSTKVGAVIVDDNHRVISVGYNGFAKNVNDDNDRYNNRSIKYEVILHAEINSILFAKRDLTDCSIYVYPIPPCSRCASAIIQSGIKKVVSIKPSIEIYKRWGKNIELSETIFKEAGVQLIYMDSEKLE